VNDEPCVPGLEIGARYRVTVLSKQPQRVSDESAHHYQDCGEAFDMTEGNRSGGGISAPCG
jgi:hypothetical protein